MDIKQHVHYSVLRYRFWSVSMRCCHHLKFTAVVYPTVVGGFWSSCLGTQEHVTISLDVAVSTVLFISVIPKDYSIFISLIIYASTEIFNRIQAHMVAWTSYLGVTCRLSMSQSLTT